MTAANHLAPLVVVGSLAATPEMWHLQAPHWQRARPVLLYAPPGHGDGRPGDMNSVAQIAADILLHADRKGFATFDYVGLSLGAMAGLHLAAHAPTRVHRLMLANFRCHQTPVLQAQWNDRIATVQQHGMNAIVQPTLERWLTPDCRTRHPEREALARKMILGVEPRGYAAAASAVRDFDARPWLGQVTHPVLVLSGDSDVAAPFDHLRELASTLADGRYLCFERCNHLSNLEWPELFTRVSMEFLGTPEQSASI